MPSKKTTKKKRPSCVLLVGLPAAGKSTFRKELLRDNPDAKAISTDDIIEIVAQSNGKTYDQCFSTAIKDAEKLAMEYFDTAIAAKTDIIIDRTNLTPKSRKKWLSKLPKTYEKVAIVFDVPPKETWESRLYGRPGKKIPWETIDTMLKNFEVPTTAEGFHQIMQVQGW